VTALVPDLTFLHAPCATASGRAFFSAPYGEGLHAAFGARLGVVVTAERIVEESLVAHRPDLSPLPAHRVLAVCEAPFGAHPQPLLNVPGLPEVQSYADDYLHYELWRDIAADASRFESFERQVLRAPEVGVAYAAFVGADRLASLRRDLARHPRSSVEPASSATALHARKLTASERLTLLGARVIVSRVLAARYRAILAGIGQSFAAVRLAKLLLEGRAEVEIMVETGFSGVEVEEADPFLLSSRNVLRAKHLGSIETVLGALTCGGANSCLGVIGAAQIDEQGNVNSTLVGRNLLVGSGGANDIASSAREVVVLTRANRSRLVHSVDHVTSPGRRVTAVATDRGTLERKSKDEPWVLFESELTGDGEETLSELCPFSVVPSTERLRAPTRHELEGLARVLALPPPRFQAQEVLGA
jgi:hypothetical protein